MEEATVIKVVGVAVGTAADAMAVPEQTGRTVV